MIPGVLNIPDTRLQTSLERFTTAQEQAYAIALSEIKNGRKKSHWMWYIFPQVSGLGFTETSRYYAIKDLDEARRFLDHPVLGKRLMEITNTLVQLDGNDATRIFGTPDDLKLRSSMTLFAMAAPGIPVFKAVLDKFFNGAPDERTRSLIDAG